MKSMNDNMSILTKDQEHAVSDLSRLLDYCYTIGLNLKVMDGSVYLGTDIRYDDSGGLIQDDHHHVKTNILADGGGW